ncbi:uncharacterized protein LOC144149988 [Haemaphysalis longicornis]
MRFIGRSATTRRSLHTRCQHSGYIDGCPTRLDWTLTHLGLQSWFVSECRPAAHRMHDVSLTCRNDVARVFVPVFRKCGTFQSPTTRAFLEIVLVLTHAAVLPSSASDQHQNRVNGGHGAAPRDLRKGGTSPQAGRLCERCQHLEAEPEGPLNIMDVLEAGPSN